MVDQLIDKVFSEGGLWCCLCVYMILYTNKKYTALEKDVRDSLSDALKESTKAINSLQEFECYADKNKR